MPFRPCIPPGGLWMRFKLVYNNLEVPYFKINNRKGFDQIMHMADALLSPAVGLSMSAVSGAIIAAAGSSGHIGGGILLAGLLGGVLSLFSSADPGGLIISKFKNGSKCQT